MLAFRSPVLSVVELKRMSRECSITEELDKNHQWFQSFLLDINVFFHVTEVAQDEEIVSDSTDSD